MNIAPRAARPDPTDRLAVHALKLVRGYRSRWADTDIGRLHLLEVRGDGPRPTVVLLHGLSSAGAHLAPLIRALRPTFSRLVAPDLPGHGLSAVPPAGARLSDLDAALARAIDHVAHPEAPVVLFGNSLGGFAAIRYALARPERVRALVLASPGGAALPEHEHQAFMSRFTMRTHGDALGFVDRVLDAHPLARHVMAWGLRRRLARPSLRALLDLAAHEDLLAPHELARLAMPTLCLWGERDGVLPASAAAFFKRHLPAHARFEIPARLGHSPYLERPDVVARRIVGFVDACLGGLLHGAKR